MQAELSNLSKELTYVSVYDKSTGERITSFVTRIHADTLDALKALAEKQYPDDIRIVQAPDEYNQALQGDLIYRDGALVERPAPSEDEIRNQKLAALDSEYAGKISDVETEMAKAKAIEDDDYFGDLKTQREELVTEYTEKRGEI